MDNDAGEQEWRFTRRGSWLFIEEAEAPSGDAKTSGCGRLRRATTASGENPRMIAKHWG
jgi:hypothetical protein